MHIRFWIIQKLRGESISLSNVCVPEFPRSSVIPTVVEMSKTFKSRLSWTPAPTGGAYGGRAFLLPTDGVKMQTDTVLLIASPRLA